MNWAAMHPAEQLARMMRRIYKQGMTTTSGGNLSIKDGAGNVWITVSGVDKGNLTRQDIVCIKPDGQVKGKYKPSGELPFHQAIYQARPDIKAVLHAHSPALVTFSLIRQLPECKLFPQTYFSTADLGMAEYALSGSELLAEKIVSVFAAGRKLVLLENHGIVVGAENLLEAYKNFAALENSAAIEINARQIGKPINLSTNELNTTLQNPGATMPVFKPKGYVNREPVYRQKMCILIKRAFEQGLLAGSWGAYSQRLSADTFIITPESPDFDTLTLRDLVRIECDCREEGKIPASAVLLHKEIYQSRPYINSIITARPPHSMAYAVAGTHLTSHTIMESYLFLRNIPLLAFECAHANLKQASAVLTKSTPVAIIQNYGVAVTGESMFNAYDRLEVIEFNAKTLLAAKSAGVEPMLLNEKQLVAIEKLYNL